MHRLTMHRRAFLRYATASALAAAAPRTFAQPAQPGLKDLARRCNHSLQVGCVLDRWHIQDPQLVPLILANFNLASIATLKWAFIRPSPTTYNFDQPDAVAAFCQQHSLAMHGHNLCWNAGNPAWLTQSLTKANAAQLLSTHIRTVMARYAGKISSWDVVNEPIASWMGRPDGLYTGPWLDALGPSYIDHAFHAAAEADPRPLRVLNLHHVEQGTDDTARSLTLRLVEGLLQRNVPVQAIGFESHLDAAQPAGSNPSRAAFIRNLRQLGLQILLTETDVSDTQIPGTIPQRDAAVAACYRDYLTSLLPQAQPRKMIFFSAADKKNWYDAMHTPAFTRADGAAHRPGLWDLDFAPKPAYTAVAAALQAACG